MRKRYVLHPGFIVSIRDRDKHYISAHQLARLYGVCMEECYIDYELKGASVFPLDLIHLHPSYVGNYSLPSK